MMVKQARKSGKKFGLPPGSLVHTGKDRGGPVEIAVIDYDDESVQEHRLSSVESCAGFRGTPTVTWINVNGLRDIRVIETIGEQFSLHRLVLEDIVNTTQRPKVEDYGETLFVVVRMLMWDDDAERIKQEQVSFVLGDGFLLSFQEEAGDVFDVIRERIRLNKGVIRQMKADYLLYALLDAIVDGCFLTLEHLGQQIEDMEDPEMLDPTPETLQRIRRLKRQTIELRRSVWPLRDVASGLEYRKSDLITKETSLYTRDLYDHSVRVIDTAETHRDLLGGVLDIYLSSVSNRMNEVMKVLTIIATIFIPLTFVAGIYGMNFNTDVSPWNMPELGAYYGYPLTLLVMALIAGAMLLYFRKKRWL